MDKKEFKQLTHDVRNISVRCDYFQFLVVLLAKSRNKCTIAVGHHNRVGHLKWITMQVTMKQLFAELELNVSSMEHTDIVPRSHFLVDTTVGNKFLSSCNQKIIKKYPNYKIVNVLDVPKLKDFGTVNMKPLHHINYGYFGVLIEIDTVVKKFCSTVSSQLSDKMVISPCLLKIILQHLYNLKVLSNHADNFYLKRDNNIYTRAYYALEGFMVNLNNNGLISLKNEKQDIRTNLYNTLSNTLGVVQSNIDDANALNNLAEVYYQTQK